MKKYIAAGIMLILAFGILITWAGERLILGAAAGVIAGLASICFAKASISAKACISARQGCSQESEPRFRWWYFLSGMVLATYFGALMALQSGLPTLSARLVVGTSAGILEGIAFMSLTKGVRASHQADVPGRSGRRASYGA